MSQDTRTGTRHTQNGGPAIADPPLCVRCYLVKPMSWYFTEAKPSAP
ncbi:MAG: hypothetical protein JWP40_4511 [Blastococcus sp.]|nr:hypothetical protein [Blastococcus sp.]